MIRILIVLLLLLIFAFSIHTFTSINQDIGRHLALGKIIWEIKEVPKTNLFSYTNPDFPFINHHWLGEVFLYFGSVGFGLKGLIIFKAFIITAAFALTFFSFYKRETAVFSAIGGLISIFILIERTDVRPEIFSFLFLGWYLFVLFRKPDSKLFLWTLPLVQLIWANTHIYFFLGPLIFLLFLINRGLLINNDRLKLIAVAILVFTANLMNPNGLDGALYPLFALDNYGYSIVENQGPFFLKAWGYPWLTTYALFVGIIFGVISFLLNIRNFRKNIFGFSLFVTAIIFSLKMIRNYPIFALTIIPIALKNFSEAGVKIESKKTFLSFSFLLTILIFSVATNDIYDEAGMARRFGLHVPQGSQKAVDFVRENSLRGPIFNNFDVGSFLIWKLPEEKVFIDGRPEAYPADFIQNVYIPMQEDPKSWERYSKQYGINYVFWLYSDITPWSQKFTNFMLKNPDWPLVYKDSSVMIFVKKQ